MVMQKRSGGCNAISVVLFDGLRHIFGSAMACATHAWYRSIYRTLCRGGQHARGRLGLLNEVGKQAMDQER